MVTIKDIARELNLNPSTVSRTLNDSPVISDETKQKVMALADKYNYRPNRVARSLVNNNTYTIGYMIPDISDSFFSDSAFIIENIVRNSGHEIAYYSTQRKSEKVLEFLELAAGYRYNGVLITPDVWEPELIKAIQMSEIPVVCIRRKTPPGLNIPFVDSDHAGGIVTAVDYLVDLGHKCIAFIGYAGEVGTERENSFVETMAKHKLKPIVHINPKALQTKKRIPAGYESTDILMDMHPEITAFCTADDYMALGSMECLNNRNIKVPEHISVIGFDNNEFSGFYCTQISTIAQFQEEIGRQAADMLLNMIKNPNYEPVSIALPTKLIIRNSTGPCRQ